MSQANGKLERLTAQGAAALTTPAQAKTPEERREAMRRATEGLRAEVPRHDLHYVAVDGPVARVVARGFYAIEVASRAQTITDCAQRTAVGRSTMPGAISP